MGSKGHCEEGAQSRNPCSCNATCRLPKRYMVAILAFLGFANIYAMRVNLSVAIAVMVANHTVLRDGQEIEEPAEFNWSTKLQGFTLSAFYLGYILMQLPGGLLARKFGGATMLGLGVGISGILTLFTPLAARAHVGVLIALRIAIGLSEGVIYPSAHALWSAWAPPLERTKLTTLNFGGARFGAVISMFLSGYLAFDMGWPSIFYVFGVSGILWSVIWFALVRNSPSAQPWISTEELEYIESSLADDVQSKDTPVPWKAIFTSIPLWAILVAHGCEAWGHFTMLSELPLYFSQRLHFDIKESSTASALPYVAAILVVLLGGQLADYLRKNHLTTGTVRKIFNTSGLISMAVFLIAADYTTDPQIAVLLFTLGVGLNALPASGFLVNHLDIAPPFASILMGITSTVGTTSGIITPTLTGLIVQHHSAAEWRTVFYINGAICVFGSIFYVLFASGEKQPWAKDNNDYAQLVPSDLTTTEDEDSHT